MSLDTTRIEKFKHIVNNTKGIVILITQPDPDALGSAMGLRALLATISKVPVRICYSGAFGHPQNRSMANMFGLYQHMTPVENCQIGPNDSFALVDSSELEDARVPKNILPIDPVIIIDHHRSQLPDEGDNHFFWVEDVGSASTMVVELIDAMKMTIDDNLALMLALGIYTDTKALVAASQRDRHAYGLITANLDPQKMARLINYSLPSSHFTTLSYALDHMEQVGSTLLVNAGVLKQENGDDISTIADYLLRKEGVTLVVVWGLIGNIVRISARNNDISVALSDFLQERFGKHAAGAKLAPDGHGEGGGRINLDLGILSSPGVAKELEALISARMRELIFQ